jgi:hypothetical protein
MNTKPMTKVEINTQTSKWRFLDLQLKVYSSEEYKTRKDAAIAATKYRKKHGINKKLKNGTRS